MHRYRSHTCGALREANVGEGARLSGWVHRVRDHGGLLFIDLRDHFGITQCVVDPDSDAFKLAETVRAEWAKDPARYRSAPLWDVSHILCACDPRDDEERAAAEARATALLAKLDGEAKGFAAAARESDCGSKASGGHLGQLGPGDTVPEFEAALRKLDEGGVSPAPVLSRHGWHIIRLNAIAPGQVLPYDAVRPKIAQALEKAAWARASRDFIETLAAGATIEGASLAPI